MGRYASTSSNFVPAPAGTHVARCVRMVDIGTQIGEYLGEAITRVQVIVMWELPNAKMQDGQPFIVSAWYTNSLHAKANLRRHLEAWRGRIFTPEELKRFDLETILGKPCLLQVAHSESGRAKVVGCMALPKGTVVPPQVNPSTSFWIDTATDEQFAALGKLSEYVALSDEWKKRKAGKPAAETPAPSPAGAAPEPAEKLVEPAEENIPF